MFKLSVVFAAGLVAAQGPANLTAYCELLESKCTVPHGITAAKCLTAFANIPLGTVGNTTDHNSIACRLKYLNNAAFNSTNSCRYAGATGGGRCGAVLESVCSIATTTCQGVAETAYPSVGACTAPTTGLGDIAHQWGSLQGVSATDDNSLECRVYHALVGGATHCPHYSLANGTPCNKKIKPSVKHYCDLLEYNCLLSGSTAQFAATAQCNATGAGFPTNGTDSADKDTLQNSLGCREYHAQASKADAATHCQHAGPSGGGACGSLTEAWGSVLAAAPCNDNHIQVLVSKISKAALDAAIPIGINFNTGDKYNTGFDNGNNTQTCRLYHLGVASTAPFGVNGHCGHGAISGGGACGNLGRNLCDFLSQTCGFGGNSTWQYADLAACNAQFNSSLATGTTLPLDTDMDTYECRFYHAGVAAQFKGVAAEQSQLQFHCSHALRASAGGTCGKKPVVAPTTAPAGNGTKNSASAISLASSLMVAGVAVFVF